LKEYIGPRGQIARRDGVEYTERDRLLDKHFVPLYFEFENKKGWRTDYLKNCAFILYREGHHVNKIAELLDVSRHTVRNWRTSGKWKARCRLLLGRPLTPEAEREREEYGQITEQTAGFFYYLQEIESLKNRKSSDRGSNDHGGKVADNDGSDHGDRDEDRGTNRKKQIGIRSGPNGPEPLYEESPADDDESSKDTASRDLYEANQIKAKAHAIKTEDLRRMKAAAVIALRHPEDD